MRYLTIVAAAAVAWVAGGAGAAETRRIVYAIDFSEGARTHSAFVVDQARKSIEALKPVHAFRVVLVREPLVVGGEKLRLASPEAKREAAEFLKGHQAGGKSNIAAGLAEAYQDGPELIYLLVSGRIDDGDAVLAAFRKLDERSAARVNTIHVGTHEATARVLKTISEESGGNYRNVDPKEVGEK